MDENKAKEISRYQGIVDAYLDPMDDFHAKTLRKPDIVFDAYHQLEKLGSPFELHFLRKNYTLGLLDEDQVKVYESHLEKCPICNKSTQKMMLENLVTAKEITIPPKERKLRMAM